MFLKGAKRLWSQYKKDKSAVVGLAIIIASIFIAVFAPFLYPQNPFELSSQPLMPPCSENIIGSDFIGRDLLGLMIYGTRISLIFAVGASGISLILGIIFGSISGYCGGLIDDIFARILEVFLLIPRFFIILIVVAIYGTKIIYAIIVVGLTIWPSNARITRVQVKSIKKQGYVQAAIGYGASGFRILIKHILPNSLQPVIANSTLQMGYAILFEASLSFLGFGDPALASWGQILSKARFHIGVAWWLMLYPGIAIAILVIAFNLVGDGINTALNPRLTQR